MQLKKTGNGHSKETTEVQINPNGRLDKCRAELMAKGNEALVNIDPLDKDFAGYRPLMDPTVDPIDWCISMKKSFPILSACFFEVCAIQATQTDSERLLLKAGRLIDYQRRLLEPSKAEKIIFINKEIGELYKR
ncbi:MAG: hypothetical protein MHMPM18_001694 [Marteilia pararefringens]